MQGRLRNESLEVEITSACAHCGSAMQIVADNDLNHRIVKGGPAPLVFEPAVDWSRFKEPHIIDGY